jgi:hypothetical protein
MLILSKKCQFKGFENMAMYLLTVNGMKQNLLNLFLVTQDCLVIKAWVCKPTRHKWPHVIERLKT